MNSYSAVTGTKETVTRLVDAYGKMVMAICVKTLRDRESALDASQNVWAIVIGAIGKFRGESDPGTWIYAIAYREALRMARRERRMRYRDLMRAYHRPESQPVPPGDSMDGGAMERWIAGCCDNCVTGVIKTLNPRARAIFVFRFISGLSFGDIARITGMREDAVRQAATRARKRLASFLERECGIFRKGSPCRCGMERYLRDGEFRGEMLSLRTMSEKAIRLHEAGSEFPPIEYWEKILGARHERRATGL